MAVSNPTVSIANAIANAEGFGVPGKIPTVRHNPGNLVANGQIQTFATDQDGWNALYNQVNLMISGQSAYYSPGMTWNQIAQSWTTTGPSTWASNVASTLGVDPNSTLGDYVGGSGGFSFPYIPGASTQPLIDFSGNAATMSTSDILSSLQSSVGLDLTDPTTDIVLLAAGAAALYFLAR